ncbi:DUF3817 domain-containing protein [uncultured Microbacterium sp.]|uniref:DUF3817 domain-containing protein n=1 Tax=uncultured Microbacterium sp. TaxID=191216 RepID=UPI002602B482|nr:DUF3817 domain-containing protein [uncultured Microbacterium sp.]
MFRTPARLYRMLAIAEAITWTLLIAGLITRAVGGPALAVTIGGGIHGFVFLAYGATAILVALNQRWKIGVAALAIGSAVVPFATIPTEIWLHRTGRLRGDWRLDESDHPQDRTWYDRSMRWALRRAGILVAVVAVAVVALYVILLLVGPPGR